MSKSLVLAIDELAPNQVQAFAVVNDMLAALEAASNSTLLIDASDIGNHELAELNFTRYYNFVLSLHTDAFTFVVPSTVNAVASDRTVAIVNDGDFTITVETDAAGENVELPPHASAIVRVVGDDVFLLMYGSFTKSNIAGYIHAHDVPESFIWAYSFLNHSSVFLANWCTPGVGNATFTAQPDDADEIIINDGFKEVTFEFESGGGVGGGSTAVTIGASVDATGYNLMTAINAADLNVVAFYDTATDICTIKNLNGVGGSITATNAAPDFTVTSFTGGVTGARGFAGTPPTETTYFPLVNRIADPHGVLRVDPFGNMAFFGAEPQTGSILFNAQVDDADIIVINDGFLTLRFEFESGGGVTAGNIAVTIGGSQDLSAQALRDAIMASKLNVEARFDAGTDTISLLNWNGTGGSITKTDADNDMTVTNFSGGAAAAAHTFLAGDGLLVTDSFDDTVAPLDGAHYSFNISAI